ncbi:hypothetical protein NS319_03940 [Sphingomonas sanguinis]|uniref:Uncharacterized protein n=1 Tax=Sphingomonas sanguinis TaxID=33051 RepID=A0A147I428_9SPHN|nr:hypothetical protein NS319_03940 [Sphingomonas sanguinis]
MPAPSVAVDDDHAAQRSSINRANLRRRGGEWVIEDGVGDDRSPVIVLWEAGNRRMGQSFA